MKLTAELTLYPLKDDYLSIIKAIVAKLNSYEGVQVQTFPTATIVVGEFETVMACVREVVLLSYQSFGKCVFLVKFLPGYEALPEEL